MLYLPLLARDEKNAFRENQGMEKEKVRARVNGSTIRSSPQAPLRNNLLEK